MHYLFYLLFSDLFCAFYSVYRLFPGLFCVLRYFLAIFKFLITISFSINELLIFYRAKMKYFLVSLYFLRKIFNRSIYPVANVYTRHCLILPAYPVTDF